MSQSNDTYDTANPYAAPRPETTVASGQVDFQGDDHCTIRYELTVGDYDAAAALTAAMFPWKWSRLVLIMAAVSGVFGTANLFWSPDGPLNPGSVFYLFVAILLVLYASPIWKYRGIAKARKAFRESVGPVGCKPIRLMMSPEGLDLNSSEQWTSLYRVHTTNTHVFLWHTDRTFLIVPRRCFLTQEAFERFVAIAKRYVPTDNATW